MNEEKLGDAYLEGSILSSKYFHECKSSCESVRGSAGLDSMGKIMGSQGSEWAPEMEQTWGDSPSLPLTSRDSASQRWFSDL